MRVIFASSAGSYRCPVGASRSARAITSSASRASAGLPAELRQPLRPAPRPGSNAGRGLVRDKGFRRRGTDGRQVKGHGKLAG